MKRESVPSGAFDDEASLPPGDGVSLRAAAGLVRNSHLLFAAALVFLLPNAIFAMALRPAAAVVVLIGCAGAARLLWRAPAGGLIGAAIDAPRLALCLFFGFSLCLLGGQGHFFFASADWLIRDAVLADLVHNGLTVVYRHENQDYLLRAPLGMYLIPAVVGRLSGLYAAHLALLAQSSFLVGAIAYFAAQLANVRQAPFLLLLIGFSGLDILPILLAEAMEMARGGEFMPFTHIEWWGTYFSPVRLQYSSHITQLFWVPNHMAPGWWFALLSLLYVRREIDLAALLVTFASLLMWSPLAMMGAAPFVALFALESPALLFRPRTLAAAAFGLLFLPIALYLSIDAGAVRHEFLYAQPGFALQHLIFLAIEIPQAAIVLYAWDKVEASDRRLLALALALLLVIPVYSLGPANDFAMRASIPSLFLLAFAFARIATLTPRDNGRFATTISVLVILGAVTPLVELARTLRHNYAISDCNMLTSWRKVDGINLPTNYWARVEKLPHWLISAPESTPLTLEERQCWPDHPQLSDSQK
jgi:hypothetical protein